MLEAWQTTLLGGHNIARARAMPAPSPALVPLTWNAALAATASCAAHGSTFSRCARAQRKHQACCEAHQMAHLACSSQGRSFAMHSTHSAENP